MNPFIRCYNVTKAQFNDLNCIIQPVKENFMLKHSPLSHFLLASILVVITTMMIFYHLPKHETAQINTLISPPISPIDTLAISPSSSFQQPLHISDSKALLLYTQGLGLYYQRQFPEALELFDRALAIDPLCYEALNAKGATLAFQGKYEQGLALIQQALVLNPSFVYGNFNLGLANELAGRWDPAIAAYQRLCNSTNVIRGVITVLRAFTGDLEILTKSSNIYNQQSPSTLMSRK